MDQAAISPDAGSEQTSRRVVVVGLVLVVLALGWWAQQRAKSRERDRIILQITRIQNDSMRSRLALERYLLSGDTREIDKVDRFAGMVESKLNQLRTEKTISPFIRDSLQQMVEAQEHWTGQFAKPLSKKRQSLDEGKGTLADLQIQYLMMDPTAWDRDFDNQYDQVIKSLEEKE